MTDAALSQRIEKMSDKINAIHEKVTEIAALCPVERELVAENVRIIKGTNGMAGLITRVTSLEQDSMHREKTRTIYVALLSGIVASVVGSLVALVMGRL